MGAGEVAECTAVGADSTAARADRAALRVPYGGFDLRKVGYVKEYPIIVHCRVSGQPGERSAMCLCHGTARRQFVALHELHVAGTVRRIDALLLK